MSMEQPKETREVQYGFLEQSDFDTAIAAHIAFVEVSLEPFDIKQDVIVTEVPGDHATRNPVEQGSAHSVIGSAASFTTAGPVNLETVDQFLYAFFQKVIEQGDTVFTKTFTFFSTHPIFSDDEGHFLTWVKKFPIADVSQRVGGCIATRFKLSGARDEMLKFEADWRGYGTGWTDQNLSGTWTSDDGDSFVYFNDALSATLSFDVGFDTPIAVVVKDFEIDISHEYEKVGHMATGFESHALHGREGTFKVNLLHDSTVADAISALRTGTMVEFTMDFGLLAFTVTGKVEDIEYSEDGLMAESLVCSMKSTYADEVVGEMATVVVENTVDRSWPAA